jgi:indolepyruvate ferredoxin oxidoreductase beta subunit
MSARPVSVLIAALGGEGGGVLTDWIIAAAASCDLPVQSTSIPGVAQRTGATTYYIEIYPTPWRELGGKRPVLALSPGIGDVDMVVASEFLEASRAIAGGFVTPERTLLIASTHRSHAIAEKMAMSDGRFDTARLMGAVDKNARSHMLFDMDATATAARAMINSVMLGAVAASGGLPIPAEAFEAAIRAGKSSEANLRGFGAGFAAAGRGVAARSPGSAGVSPASDRATGTGVALSGNAGGTPAVPGNLAHEAARFGIAADIVREGLRRLLDYQDISYARLYLDRLAPIVEADARAGAQGRLVREVARHLALRMSYEDVIRVAQAKIAPERIARIAAQMGATKGEPVTVVEFLKPGIAEMCSVLPRWIARPIITAAERRRWTDKLHWGMEIKTTSVSGYLCLLALARLRRLRPQSLRYSQEQAAIEAWLALIAAAAAKSGALALEIAECARLIKGYGDTLKRGAANYATIERQVIQPILADTIALSRGVDAVASARVAALADPEGESLAKCLAEIAQMSDAGGRSPLGAVGWAKSPAAADDMAR